jgi:hypothetical protein
MAAREEQGITVATRGAESNEVREFEISGWKLQQVSKSTRQFSMASTTFKEGQGGSGMLQDVVSVVSDSTRR